MDRLKVSSPWTAFVFHLSSPAIISIDAGQGQALHGMFFDFLRKLNPALAEELHQGAAQRPFTLSPLTLSKAKDWRPIFKIQPNDMVRWRVTSLNSELSHLLKTAWLSSRQAPNFILQGKELKLERFAMTSQDSEGWAKHLEPATDWIQIEPLEKISLDFVTPTAFRRGDNDLPLPLPELVFGGLAQRLEQLAPGLLPVNFYEWLERGVRLARHEIKTAKLNGIGFVGTVGFELHPESPLELARWIHRLAHLAFYTGIGRKTAMGMGMARATCCK